MVSETFIEKNKSKIKIEIATSNHLEQLIRLHLKHFKGVGGALFHGFRSLAKKRKLKYMSLGSRNRFRRALVFYLKNGGTICGVDVETDGDLMINIRFKL